MKRCKWLWSVLVVLIALSMSLSPASAQDETPTDNKGTQEIVNQMDGAVPPFPLSPLQNQRVYTKTPKFIFTPHKDATSYRILVYNGLDALVYTYEDPGTCTASLCVIKPPYTLKTFRYINTAKTGFYKWQVEAYQNTTWLNSSQPVGFYVHSKGFASTFDLDSNNWLVLNGDWTRTSKGYFKTDGAAGLVASVMQIEYFEGDFVYEVRLKRKVEPEEPNAIFISGTPDPMRPDGTWGYMDALEFTNSGAWRFLRFTSSTVEPLATGMSPYINPFGWNTWTIWTRYPDIYIWVNEVFVATVTEPNPISGYVGVGMYKSTSVSSPLLVDYATLYYSSIRPMEVPGEVDTRLE